MPFSGNYAKWKSDIIDPLLKGSSVSQPIVFFYGGTNQTQQYVFESDTLPEIRGGSQYLSALNTPAKIGDYLRGIGLGVECLIYAGGGKILAVLPADADAETLTTLIQADYARQTNHTATFSAIYHTFTPQQLKDGFTSVPRKDTDPRFQKMLDVYHQQKHHAFGEVMTLMSRLLRKAKSEREQAPFFETMPFASLCTSCRIRPANHHQVFDDGKQQTLCATCYGKGNHGRRIRRNLTTEFQRALLQAGYPLPDNYEYPQDIGEIVAISDTVEDDLALVYADGDKIGERIRNISTLSDYKDFSRDLSQITQHSVAQALTASPALRPRSNGVLPWEIIFIGGDDVLILMRATAALDFAVALAQYFQKAGQSMNVRMSVGFAIARPSTPIRLLRETADSALQNAKRRSYLTGQPAIDFHHFVKEGSVSGDLQTWRGSQRRDGLTGRPYTINEASQLQTSLHLLRKASFPRSQLYGLCEQLEQGPVRGSLYYYYQQSRLNPARRQVLEHIASIWQPRHTIQNALQTPTNEWPWLQRQSTTYTTLLDMVNLL